MGENQKVEFIAYVKQVTSKALVSLDKSARIILETEDLNILEIGKWPANEMVKVIIERDINNQ